MTDTELKKVTMDELRRKETSKKQRIFIIVILCLSMIYFPISNFLKGEKLELIPIFLFIVLIVGLFMEYSGLRKIKKLKNTTIVNGR